MQGILHTYATHNMQSESYVVHLRGSKSFIIKLRMNIGKINAFNHRTIESLSIV